MPKSLSRRAAASQLSSPNDERAELLSPLAESPSFLMRLAQLRAFDEFYRQFAGLGVTPAGFSVFALIIANPGVRPGAIAEELQVKPSNVAALVNALVAAGYVQRSTDTAELRACLLYPTAAGRKAWQEMEQAHLRVEARLLEPLTPAERKQLVNLLRKLLHR